MGRTNSVAAVSGAEPGASGSSSRRKVKNLQCRYCPNVFHRLEHIQRHERTHTKEKPFACACGKAFARRDLLLRHEKLVHDIQPSRHHGRSTTDADVPAPPPLTGHSFVGASLGSPRPSSNMPVEEMRSNWASQDPDLNLNGVHQYASSESYVSRVSEAGFLMGHMEQQQPDNVTSLAPPNMGSPNYAMAGPVQYPTDYNLFLDNFDMSNFYLPAAVVNSELPISLWSRPQLGEHAALENLSRRGPPARSENDALSRFGSRLPSLRPEEQNLMDTEPSPQADFLRAGPPWKICAQDHGEVELKLRDFADVLPDDFNLPSRHTLSRYLEGYISGFHQHLPFLHIPTFAISQCVPELVLAIMAVGAQYRFESTKGNKLWYAAKAVAAEQTRRRHSQQIADILVSPSPGFASLSKSPASNPELEGSNVAAVNNANRQNANHQTTTRQTASLSNDPRSSSAQARLGTIQAYLILMAMGMWGPQALLREAMIIQTQLALLIREHGFGARGLPRGDLSWEDWILFEGDCRTKCIAYCFFNLHSIAYDTPPLLITSELKMNLPQCAESWRAVSTEEWQLTQRNGTRASFSFHHVLSGLFATVQEDLSPISSLGNYVLIHAIIQQIYFVRQASTMANPVTRDSSLQPEDIVKFGEVLRLWQIGWERAPESSLDPTSPYGPVAFSSTALLRLAYIRLHCDLGPCRGLDTRDPHIIAHTLKACPPLIRSPLLSRAVLQAAHAFSIPVKIGIKFVAHTQTLLWSMQHSLGNLECAFLLSKWLHMISDCMPNLSSDERNLLEMVQSIVNETHFAIPLDNSAGVLGSKEVKQLSISVVRLWSEIFTGSHHVFALVKVIGTALDIYADLVDG